MALATRTVHQWWRLVGSVSAVGIVTVLVVVARGRRQPSERPAERRISSSGAPQPDPPLGVAPAAEASDHPGPASRVDTSATLTIRTPNRPLLHEAARTGDTALLMEALQSPGCDVDATHLGHAAIHLAAKGGHVEAVTLLLQYGSDVHTRAANGATALHAAAEMNRTEVLALLLDESADLHATANRAATALHFAAFNGRLAATQLLVARGAMVDAKDSEGYLPYDDAVSKGRGRCACEDPSGREWGAVAAFLAHVTPMSAKARQAFARRIRERPEAAMLHNAAEDGDVQQLERLLEFGCRIDAKDYDGSTALHAAVEGGHVEAVALLLGWQADVLAVNNYEDTALHLAAREGLVDITRLLVARGANVHAKNKFGVTPLEWAKRKQNGGYQEVASFLESEARTMAELQPHERALRKIRAAMLTMQGPPRVHNLQGPPRALSTTSTAALTVRTNEHKARRGVHKSGAGPTVVRPSPSPPLARPSNRLKTTMETTMQPARRRRAPLRYVPPETTCPRVPVLAVQSPTDIPQTDVQAKV